MPKNEPKWIHPTHARGVQSPKLDVRGGKLLTNKKIHYYAKQGLYGTDVQAAALGRPKPKKSKPYSTLRAARNLLATLLK